MIIKRRPKRKLRECWVWWHDRIESGEWAGPCKEAMSSSRQIPPFNWHPVCSYGYPGRWVRMREVRRGR